MKPAILAIICASLGSVSAVEKPGRAEVTWVTSSHNYQPGKPVETGIRMVIDEGHHTYWINPGEGGMKTSVSWELPPGWTAGELEQPVPIRFKTGELPGFGYEGSVIFPVKLTAPADSSGVANLKGTVTWLACNDRHCIPGRAEISLQLNPGPPAPSADSVALHQAQKRVATPAEGMTLGVKESGGNLILTLYCGATTPSDPTKSEVFPVTPQVVDSAAAIRFERNPDDTWTATVPKSEYLTGPPTALDLVLAGPGTSPPLSIGWKK